MRDGESQFPLPTTGTLDELDRLATRAIWPGFDPRAVPVALYDGERTILARHPDPPSGFTALTDRPDLVSYPAGMVPSVLTAVARPTVSTVEQSGP